MKKWIKEHGSAIYISLLLIMGLGGFVLGFLLTQSTNTKWKPLGDFAVQIFGSLIAVALTAVFFSISDMRNSFAQIVADLLGRGDVARHLTDKDKKHLAKRIMEARAADCCFDADHSLFDHLDEITVGTINTIYLKDVQHRKSLQRIPKDPHKLKSELSMSYVVCRPPGASAPFPHRIEHIIQWNAPIAIAPKGNEWVTGARIRVGDKNYGKEDLVIETDEPKDELVTCRCTFSKCVELNEPLQFSFRLTLVSSVLDPVDIKIAPCACNGFSVDLQFEPDLFYDAMFFGATTREKATIERGLIERRNNGISCRYNGWILPGEGVLSYYQTGCNAAANNQTETARKGSESSPKTTEQPSNPA